MNSWYHAQSAAKKWGGVPEDYLPIEEFIDSSKKIIGDVRHRSLYHHTEGCWLVQRIFGATISVSAVDIPEGQTTGRVKRVPTRLIAERHIIEDLGWLPSPADYIRDLPISAWMGGKVKREASLNVLGLSTGGNQ